MTATTSSGKKLDLPDPSSPPAMVDIDDISFVEVKSVAGGRLVLRIYLKSGSSVDVPATSANVAFLERMGFSVGSKHLIAAARLEAAPAPADSDPKSPEKGEPEAGPNAKPEPQTATAAKKKSSRPK